MIRTLARPLLASAFAVDGVQMLLNSSEYTENAKTVTGTLRGVLPPNVSGFIPNDPETAVRAAGTTKVVASAMLGMGKSPRLAATTLTAIQIPTTVVRHSFWNAKDDNDKKNKQRGIISDLALLGALALTAADTAGKPGLTWRAKKALPGKSEQEKMAANAQEQAQSLLTKAKDSASQAQSAVSDYVDDHSDEWKDMVSNFRDQAADYADKASGVASAYFEEASDAAQEKGKKAQKQAKKAQKKAQKRAKKAAKKNSIFG